MFEAEGVARVPALWGLFVEDLGRHAGRVTLYAHGESTGGVEDYRLGEPFVRCVDLGPRRRFPERMFLPRRSLRAFDPAGDSVDVMLIAGPTPLLPHVVKASAGIPVALHIIGDLRGHRRDPSTRTMPWWREKLIRALTHVYTLWQSHAARSALVLVNTPDLAKLFKGNENVEVAILSTLQSDEVVPAPRNSEPGLGQSRQARLLFTGRILPEKGLWEAVEAVRMLTDRGFDLVLDVVGWEHPREPVIPGLMQQIERFGMSERVRIVGYVPAGPELSAVYKSADIYVLPTHGEGFPRTLFEAMGVALPVVTTPVGGIPHWIHDEVEALFVDPRSSASLAKGLERMLTDDDLRGRVSRGGWEFARKLTLEEGSRMLIQKMSDWALREHSRMSTR